jgi:hypothetical protein
LRDEFLSSVGFWGRGRSTCFALRVASWRASSFSVGRRQGNIAVSQQSPGYTSGAGDDGRWQRLAGAGDANNIFNGNVSNFSRFTNLQVNSTVAKTGVTLASNVTFSATAPTMFLGVIRHPAIETSVVQVIRWS